MAPELVQGQRYAPACDVYSLGLVMVYVLTCQKPALTQAERQSQVHHHHECGVFALCCTQEDPDNRPAATVLASGLGIHGSVAADHPATEKVETNEVSMVRSLSYPTHTCAA